MKRVKFHNSLLHNLRTVLWPNTVKWAPKGTQALRTPSGNEIYQIKAKSKSDLSDEVGLIVMLLVMITKWNDHVKNNVVQFRQIWVGGEIITFRLFI